MALVCDVETGRIIAGGFRDSDPQSRSEYEIWDVAEEVPFLRYRNAPMNAPKLLERFAPLELRRTSGKVV